MALLVRSWNVFHGNSVPPRRRGYLRDMVELAIADAPDVLCLQELPVWSADHLADWSGMAAFVEVARPPWRPVWLSGLVTRVHNGLLRSAFAGQANAILARPGLDAHGIGSVQVSDPGRERRICHAVRAAGIVIATTHLSAPADVAGQERELERCAAFALEHARSGEPVVIAGDLNLHEPRLGGFSAGGPGIDHVLVRGAPSAPVTVWAHGRRVENGRVLSDHAPVEATVG